MKSFVKKICATLVTVGVVAAMTVGLSACNKTVTSDLSEQEAIQMFAEAYNTTSAVKNYGIKGTLQYSDLSRDFDIKIRPYGNITECYGVMTNNNVTEEYFIGYPILVDLDNQISQTPMYLTKQDGRWENEGTVSTPSQATAAINNLLEIKNINALEAVKQAIDIDNGVDGYQFTGKQSVGSKSGFQSATLQFKLSGFDVTVNVMMLNGKKAYSQLEMDNGQGSRFKVEYSYSVSFETPGYEY